MFNSVQYQGEPISIPFEEFKKEYKNEFSKNSFSKIYKSYYDNKNPIEFDINTAKSIDELAKIDEIFSDEMVDLVYTAIALQNDVETIKQISDKAIPIKTFDYDGKKYKQKEISQTTTIILYPSSNFLSQFGQPFIVPCLPQTSGLACK